MAITFPVLGQVAPSTSSFATLVPAGSSGGPYRVVSTITVANRSATTTDYFYIKVVVAGSTDANKQYVAHGVALAPSSVTTLSLGISLGATDSILVSSTNATCSFNAFGSSVL